VADIGCGSGYGCAILKNEGATRVYEADISKPAIAFARTRYGHMAEFSVQGITNLGEYPDESCDVAISSDVLEHIKEYDKEDAAVAEIARITRSGGLVVVCTPNGELRGAHGFWFEEIDGLMRRHFTDYCIFENALVPFGENRRRWEERSARGRTGVVVTQAIKLTETVLPGALAPEFKTGLQAGCINWGGEPSTPRSYTTRTPGW
jgi:SAM-dependent methyltransferase